MPDVCTPTAAGAATKALCTVRQLARRRHVELFDVFDLPLTPDERGALEFLYAGMPLCDLAEHNGDFFLEAVRATLEARNRTPWGRAMPEEVFRHYVLPLRVNTENLDNFRAQLGPDLLERVKGLSMRQAALEVNHWCYERVVYQSTDGRTSGPLATIRTAFGRCGEESTLTVSALRAACIPARQIYTPRWAHCDDNHAWVEVWVEGDWHYLGACEPEAMLDVAWFREPARRVMLVHTKAYGPYEGSDQVVRSSEQFAELNLTARYAPARTVLVRVTGADGNPVRGAAVDFRLFNTGEFFALAARETDVDGTASLEMGHGDLLVWARGDGACGFRFIRGNVRGTVTIPLDFDPTIEATIEFDQSPPPEPPRLPVPDDGEECLRRMLAADEIRTATVSAFMDEHGAYQLARALRLDPDRVRQAICKSCGNWEQIAHFLRSTNDETRPWALDLLECVSEKDLRDTPASVLRDHLENAVALLDGSPPSDAELFRTCVLCPRVDNELIVAYRSTLRDHFEDLPGRADPVRVAAWIRENIRVEDDANYVRTPLTPLGVFNLRVADSRSRDIFFVAACRSLGVPARLEPAIRAPQFFRDGEWINADVGGPVVAERGKAFLRLDGQGADPKYGTHFTLARFTGGEYVTLGGEEGLPLSRLPAPMKVPAGSYCAVTGSRRWDGTVLARLYFFSLQAEEHRTVPILLRDAYADVLPIGMLDPATEVHLGDDMRRLSALAGTKGMVICWVAPGKEPTRHLMEEIRNQRQPLDAWGGVIVFLLPAGIEAGSLGPDFADLPARSFVAPGDDALKASVAGVLGRPFGAAPPATIVLDSECSVLMFSEGYRIGIAEQVVRTLEHAGRVE